MTGNKDQSVDIRVIEKHDNDSWDQFVDAHPAGSIYHKSVWKNVIEQSFGHETHYLMATGHGQVKGVLPLVRLKGLLFGDFMVSMPYFNYGGALGESESIEVQLMRAAEEFAKRRSVAHIEFREGKRRENYPNRREDKAILMLHLPSSPDELFSSLGTKKRTRIRRPLKDGAEVQHGAAELLDQFYAVFATNMRDLGTPVYSRWFFRRVLEAAGSAAKICVLRMHQRPVAAAFLISYRNRVEVPWASALRSYNRYGVNMLLYWEILKSSIENGFEYFDFGRSTIGGSHHSFKEQWGAEPIQCYWNYWLAPGNSMPSLSPDNPKFALAISAWKKLPLPLANAIGPHIIKFLP